MFLTVLAQVLIDCVCTNTCKARHNSVVLPSLQADLNAKRRAVVQPTCCMPPSPLFLCKMAQRGGGGGGAGGRAGGRVNSSGKGCFCHHAVAFSMLKAAVTSVPASFWCLLDACSSLLLRSRFIFKSRPVFGSFFFLGFLSISFLVCTYLLLLWLAYPTFAAMQRSTLGLVLKGVLPCGQMTWASLYRPPPWLHLPCC